MLYIDIIRALKGRSDSLIVRILLPFTTLPTSILGWLEVCLKR